MISVLQSRCLNLKKPAKSTSLSISRLNIAIKLKLTSCEKLRSTKLVIRDLVNSSIKAQAYDSS